MRILIVVLIAFLNAPAQNPGVLMTHGQGPAEEKPLPQRTLARMKGFNRALGVECTHCHIAGDWGSAGKPAHAVARQMSRLVDGISKDHLDDLGGITCWTCHRGQAKPSRFPGKSLDAEMAKWPRSLQGAAESQVLTMTVFRMSLGVGCEHCHLQSDWRSARLPQHATTIRMLAMFEDFGLYIGDREGRMQCWTCHKGQPKPERNQPKR